MSRNPPDAERLYEAALNHLARYAATEASLARMLARKIDRWARQQTDAARDMAAIAAAKAEIPPVIARLKAAKLVSDAEFAASRAKRLTREGKSQRYTIAHLTAKGVSAETAAATLAPDPERELAAACAFLRRRRAGPFGEAPELKTLAAMARAGFSQQTARQAMRLDRETAEDRIKSLKE